MLQIHRKLDGRTASEHHLRARELLNPRSTELVELLSSHISQLAGRSYRQLPCFPMLTGMPDVSRDFPKECHYRCGSQLLTTFWCCVECDGESTPPSSVFVLTHGIQRPCCMLRGLQRNQGRITLTEFHPCYITYYGSLPNSVMHSKAPSSNPHHRGLLAAPLGGKIQPSIPLQVDCRTPRKTRLRVERRTPFRVTIDSRASFGILLGRSPQTSILQRNSTP